MGFETSPTLSVARLPPSSSETPAMEEHKPGGKPCPTDRPPSIQTTAPEATSFYADTNHNTSTTPHLPRRGGTPGS